MAGMAERHAADRGAGQGKMEKAVSADVPAAEEKRTTLSLSLAA